MSKILARWPGCKWVLRFQPAKLTGIAEGNHHIEWKLPPQLCNEPCAREGLPHNKGARGTDVHDIMSRQFSRELAWPEGPVAADIDTPEEYNQSLQLRLAAHRAGR